MSDCCDGNDCPWCDPALVATSLELLANAKGAAETVQIVVLPDLDWLDSPELEFP